MTVTPSPSHTMLPAEMTDTMRRAIWTSQAQESAERIGETKETVEIYVNRVMADGEQAETDRRAYRAMLQAHRGEGK